MVGGSTAPNPFTTSDAGGSPSGSPASGAATGRCVDDKDCPQGSRCNTALAPASCETVRCGPEKSACSGDDVCEGGLRCYKNVCKLCNVCGDKCEVDFQNDPNNCGSCGVVVPQGVKCVAGRLTCPDDLTLCGRKTCVNLATDPNNCGGCGTVVDVQNDPANCSACGKQCARADGDRCVKASCDRFIRGGNNTCNNVCRLQGLTCVIGGNHIGAGVPAPDACTTPYTSLTCECTYDPE
jgi:hypothetical protein